MNKIIRLKSLISSILVVALLNLCGCSSFSALTEEEIANNRPTKEDNVNFILKDGSEIRYESWFRPKEFLVRIDEPSYLIYGSGSILYKGQPPLNIFRGEIPREMIDSTSSTYVNKELRQQFWLTNGDFVTLKEGDYVDITPDDGIGYWVSGRKDGLPFMGKIDFGEIDEIQTDDKLMVIHGIIGAVLGVGLIVLWVIAMNKISKWRH